jgi:hypothetical protein
MSAIPGCDVTTHPTGETVTVLDGTATGQDVSGNDTQTWAVKAVYDDVPVAPSDANGTGGNEFTDGRDTVIAGLTIYLPDGADVAAVDRVIARGETWDVVGQPQDWLSPFTGWRPGRAVALQRVTG